jgi:broad specificity phosphatase PhoE
MISGVSAVDRILMIRHGESTWNLEDRWQGWADSPLSSAGEVQAAEAAGRLCDAGVTGVVSSDLRRARDTAGIISEALGLGPVATEPRLREYDVGDWEGLTRGEIDAEWPGVRAAWRRGELAALPGGEPRAEFVRRVIEGVAAVAARDDLGPTVLVVGHGGGVRVVERHLGLESWAVPNLSGRWVLTGGSADPAAWLPGDAVTLLDSDEVSPSSSP